MNPLDSLPPQPDASNPQAYNAWVAQTTAAIESYKAAYAARMAEQGITATFQNQQNDAPGSPVGTLPIYTVTLSRDGATSQTILSAGRAYQTDPASLADFDAAFNLKWTTQYTSPQGQLPSTWFEPDSAPVWNQYTNPAMFQPTSTPGPTPTVPVGGASVQPVQAPHTPDAGTIQPPPTQSTPVPNEPIRRSFWEWNWYYEQESGRVGPPPEAVGVASGSQLMTREEWVAAVAGWYNTTPTNGTDPGSGGTGGGGGTAPPAGGGASGGGSGGGTGGAAASDNTLLYAGLAVGAVILLKMLK